MHNTQAANIHRPTPCPTMKKDPSINELLKQIEELSFKTLAHSQVIIDRIEGQPSGSEAGNDKPMSMAGAMTQVISRLSRLADNLGAIENKLF